MKSVQDIVSKYKAGVSNGQKAYTSGVMGVRESPGVAAARAVDKYEAGVRKAVEDGSFVAGASAVSLQSWQERTAKTGSQRYAASAADAERGMAAYMEFAAPQLQAISAAVKAMPSTTEADRDARALEAIRRMRQIKYRRK